MEIAVPGHTLKIEHEVVIAHSDLTNSGRALVTHELVYLDGVSLTAREWELFKEGVRCGSISISGHR